MLTLHPVNRHSVRKPCVPVVTGSSKGWKGQSSSSESARSTTTPGWRHWAGRVWGVSHGCFCVCVCVSGGMGGFHVHYILGRNPSRQEIKKMWESQYVLTYVVDVRNVVFVNSNCLLREKEFKISITTHWDILWRLRTVGRPLPQPASWIPQSLSPWSGTSCRSPMPPYSHSSSSWSISLRKQKGLHVQTHRDPCSHLWCARQKVLMGYWPNRLMIPSL